MSLDLADIKPSLLNWMVIGFSAVTFIHFFKFFFGSILRVPGFSELFAAL